MAGGAQKKIAGLATATSDFAKQHSTSAKIAQNSYVGLQDQLRRLEDLQKRAWDTKHIQNYQKAIESTKKKISEWEAKKALPTAPQSMFSKFKGQFTEGLSQIPLPGGGNILGMLKNPALLAAAAATVAFTFGKAAAESAMNWEYGMKKINATAQLPLPVLNKLDDRLTEIGSHSGGNFARVPESYEKILSVTGKVNMSLDILQVAIKGAKAGFTDLDLVGESLARTMAVVGTQNTTAQQVMDTLLKAKAVGAGEFKDFAQYLPQLTAAGRNMGVTLEQTAGLFAYMTFTGQSAADSAMLLQNAFTALQKNDIIKGLKKYGILMFNPDGSRRAIDRVLIDLSNKISKFSDENKTKFFADIGLNDAQARIAIGALTASSENLKRIMGDVASAAGETDRQLAMTGNRKTTWAEIGDQWAAIGKDIGKVLLPLVDVLGQVIEGAIQGIKDLMSLDFWNFVGTDKKSIDGMKDDIRKTNAYNQALREYKANYKDDPLLTKLFSPVDRENISNGTALQADMPLIKGSPTERYNRFFKKRYDAWYKLFGGEDKNKIIAGELEAGVMPPAKPDPSAGSNSENDTLGGSRGPKTLIMNLDIKNYFKKDDEKVKNKHTDDIVDAGRDALIILGGNQ